MRDPAVDLSLPAAAWRHCLILVVLGTLGLTGCAHIGESDRALARRLAEGAGLREDRVAAFPCPLTVFHRGLEARAETLVVYIEGDGHAWVTRRRPSADPTPRAPLALEMALRDPSPAVLYVARPGQYAPVGSCPAAYWTSRRYSAEVVGGVGEAIDWALERARRTAAAPSGVGLIGYSGGAAIAVLVAAAREDVRWLVSVAGNLDPSAWAERHAVTPLAGSQSPVAVAPLLRSLPQRLLFGARDRNLPVGLASAYLRALGPGSRARASVIPGFTHRCCWAREWPEPLCAGRVWPYSTCR